LTRPNWNRPKIESVPIVITLAEFVRQSWHVLEGDNQLDWNWHIEAICLHVQETLLDWLRHRNDRGYQQRIQNLLINVPPGSGKSRIVSVCAPAWMWLYCPSWRAIFLSGNPRVALRDSMYCRDIIESSWYQDTFKPQWELRDDQDAKSSYWNTEGGQRMAFGIKSRITGDRADALFIDDPNELKESKAVRDATNERYGSAIHNRVNDRRTSVRIGIQQRTEIDDWTGGRLEQGGWALLKIRSRYRPPSADEETTTPIGWTDPRTEDGELMDPVRNPESVLEEDQRTLGTAGMDAQHQQDPQPLEGGMIKLDWFQRYKTPPLRHPARDRLVISIDTANKASELADYSVFTVWLCRDGFFYLLDVWRKQVEFPELKRAYESICLKWLPNEVLIEDKASGQQLIQEYRSKPIEGKIYPIFPVEPCGDKVMRMSLESPAIEAKQCYLPEAAAWLPDYESEIARFPKQTKDQVDSTSQFLMRMRTRPTIGQVIAPIAQVSAASIKTIF
jgi:predicted phage terminase large subunit-like protein